MKQISRILIACAVLASASLVSAQGSVMPLPIFQATNLTGTAPCNGCLLYTYAAGTTTALATYNASDLQVAHQNDNPVTLSAYGRATVFLSPTSYKFTLKTSGGSTIWSQDNVTAVPIASGSIDVAATAGIALTAGDCAYLSDGSGSLTAGRWYKCDADFTYASTTPVIGIVVADIALAATGTVRIQGRSTSLSGLVTGTRYYVSATAGQLTSTAPLNARGVGQADSTSSLIVAPDPNLSTVNLVNTGLNIKDASGNYTFGIVPASTFTANRTLTVTTGDANTSVNFATIPTSYTCTIANVTTNALTTFASFSVPAMLNGDWIDVTLPRLKKNNKGTDGNATFTFTYGGVSTADAAVSWVDSATEYGDIDKFILARVVNDLWVWRGSPDVNPFSAVFASGTLRGNSKLVLTTPTFTSAQTVALKLTLAATDASFYFKPQGCAVTHFHAAP